MLRRRQRAGVVAAERPVAHAGNHPIAGVEQEGRQHAEGRGRRTPNHRRVERIAASAARERRRQR